MSEQAIGHPLSNECLAWAEQMHLVGRSIGEESSKKIAAELDRLHEEVAYWRRDAIARLATATERAKHYEAKGDARRASDLMANQIMPVLAALRDADAGEWHNRCEFCNEFIRPGDDVRAVMLHHDTTTEVHARCGDPTTHAYKTGERPAPETIAEARKLVGWVAS